MEAFLRGTKRKPAARDGATPDDSEDTDVKLALLSSLFPHLTQEILLEALLEHEGSVEATSSSLLDKAAESPRKQRSGAVVGSQTSLRLFARTSPSDSMSPSPQKKPKLLSKKGTTLHLW